MSKYVVIIYAECEPTLTKVVYFDNFEDAVLYANRRRKKDCPVMLCENKQDIFEDVVETLSNFEDYTQ